MPGPQKPISKPLKPAKPDMSQKAPTIKQMQDRYQNNPFKKNQAQRDAIKKIAFVDELSKIETEIEIK